MSKTNQKGMPIFHSPIAGEMLRQRKNIPHTYENLHDEKGNSILKEGYNVTGYFPNRMKRRSIVYQTVEGNNRPRTNARKVSSRPFFWQLIQYIEDGIQKIKTVYHQIFK